MDEIRRWENINVMRTVIVYIRNIMSDFFKHFFYPPISNIPLSPFLTPSKIKDVIYGTKNYYLMT